MSDFVRLASGQWTGTNLHFREMQIHTSYAWIHRLEYKTWVYTAGTLVVKAIEKSRELWDLFKAC